MLERLFNKASGDEMSERSLHSVLSAPALNESALRSAVQNSVRKPVKIAVLGAKGGSGATTVAVNLACAFGLKRLTTTLVDANLQSPSIAHILGQEPVHALNEIIEQRTHADAHIFQACAAELTSALPLKFLSPPVDGSGVRDNLSDLALSLASIENCSQLWVFDLPNNLDRHLVTMLDEATHIVLVFEASVIGAVACRRWLNVFAELGYGDDRVTCVLNRAGSKFRTVEEQMETILGERVVLKIPNAYNLHWQSTTEGTPAILLQPNHAFSRAVVKLAATITQSLTE
jgi:pilus assembly protein CpaE